MFLLNRLSIQSKVILALLLVSVGSILAVSYIGYTNGVAAMRKSIQSQLEDRRAEKTQQLTAFLANLRNIVIGASDTRIVVDGMLGFGAAFRALDAAVIAPAWDDKLEEFYRRDFLPGLTRNLDVHPALEQYLPHTVAARYLQYHYIAANPHPYGEGMGLAQADDGSAYSRLHERYHEKFARLVKLFDFEDVLLVTADTLDIVYSYQKTTEFATNLESGPYADSNLGQMVRALRKAKDRDDYELVDFEAYRPNLGKPSSFIGSPIFDGSKMIGILVFQFPIDAFTRVMTSNFQWAKQGSGDTGEVYLVGADYTMRSRSRFMVEDPAKFITSLRDNGIAEHYISQIERQGNVLLVLPVRTASVEQALAGRHGVNIGRDYRNIPVLSAYGPLEFDSIRWAIVADMDVAVAYKPAHAFSRQVLMTGTGIALLTSLLALFSARLLVSPLKLLTAGARRISAGEEDVRVELDTQDEFHELVVAFNDMSTSLKATTEQLRRQVQENEDLLLNILPAAVAARQREGTEQAIQHFAEVTVLIACIQGFDEISQAQGAEASLSLLQDLVISCDEVVERVGVEKVKTVGASYLAVCGLSVPRPDHADRVIDCARELLRVLSRFNREHATQLVLKIGIDSGPIVGGIVGRRKFSYDLWGAAITIAQGLAANGPDAIQVTPAVYERMRDLHSFVAGNEFEVAGKGRCRAWLLEE